MNYELKQSEGDECELEKPVESWIILGEYVGLRELYRDLRHVESIRSDNTERDVYLVLKADQAQWEVVETFFVAAYSNSYCRSEQFFGLLLDHETRQMEWVEFDGRQLNWDGPGEIAFIVDESWRGVWFSEFVKQYPGYALVPEEQRRRHPRYPLVMAKNLGELKVSLHKAQDIDTVALVGHYFDLKMPDRYESAVKPYSGHFGEQERDALELAECGLLRVAAKNLVQVPEQWQPYALSLSELPDEQRCEVDYSASMYYVRLWNRILPPSRKAK